MSDTTNKPVTEAVNSLLDINHSTASLDVYKDKPMFVINKESRYPFSFGLPKAKLILKHLEALQRFVATDGKTI